MLRKYGSASYQLGEAFRILETYLLDLSNDRPLHWQTLKKIRTHKFITNAESASNGLGLESAKRQIENIKFALRPNGKKVYAEDAKQMIWQLDDRLQEELKERWFLFVEPSKTKVYTAPLDRWGDAEINFPSANFDICEASRCIALDRSTACVFHLMRVLQLGLASMARAVNSTITNPEDQNWHRVIENIQARLRDLQPGTGRAPEMSPEDRRFFSEAALQFMYFKDAFRNYVTHTVIAYDSNGAQSILNHVREFMAHLAKRLTE